MLSLVDFTVMTWVRDNSLTTNVLMNRCGNVAAILDLDENLNKKFTVFEAAPQVSVMCFSMVCFLL